MNHGTTVIGLGVMGQRMLGSMARYAGFDAEAISRDDTAVVYIACPPRWHREHALAAFEAGKAGEILGVDVVLHFSQWPRATPFHAAVRGCPLGAGPGGGHACGLKQAQTAFVSADPEPFHGWNPFRVSRGAR